MKKKKLIATVLSASMLVGLLAGCGSSTDPAESPTGGGETTPAQGETTPAQNDVDYANFVIDPAQIPQEKLDTTLYLAVSVRGLENPYIATINEGMKLFAEYLDSIGQKYEMQVLDSQGDSAKEVDNMRQFAAKANGNAIAYADPNEDTIAYSLAEAMAESGGYLGTAWNKPADVGPSDLDPNWVIHTSPDNVVNGYNRPWREPGSWISARARSSWCRACWATPRPTPVMRAFRRLWRSIPTLRSWRTTRPTGTPTRLWLWSKPG